MLGCNAIQYLMQFDIKPRSSEVATLLQQMQLLIEIGSRFLFFQPMITNFQFFLLLSKN